MAGFYADYPSHRMAYDRDGTQVFFTQPSGGISTASAANVASLNNESDDGVNVNGTNRDWYSVTYIFPELRDLDGFTYIQSLSASNSTGSSLVVQTSTDTTNAIDGTWTTVASPGSVQPGPATPTYRTRYTAAAAAGIKAVRFRINASNTFENLYPSTIHLFGKRSAGQNPNRLILWHPTLDQRVGPAHFDWGDVPRGAATTDKTFRVKNNSATLTANGVTVAFDVLTDAAPSLLVGQHSLSLDGTGFGNSINVGALAPSAISNVLTVRRTLVSGAALSVWSLRIIASATSWT